MAQFEGFLFDNLNISLKLERNLTGILPFVTMIVGLFEMSCATGSLFFSGHERQRHVPFNWGLLAVTALNLVLVHNPLFQGNNESKEGLKAVKDSIYMACIGFSVLMSASYKKTS